MLIIELFVKYVQGPQNVIFESPCKPKWIERKKYETLCSNSKNFGSQKTYKGGRRPKTFPAKTIRRPLVGQGV